MNRDLIAGVVLACAAVLAAWRPVEAHAWSAVILSGIFLAMVPWAWQKTSAKAVRLLAGLTTIWLLFLFAGQAGGWDRSEAITQVFLAGAIMAMIWLNSRQSPDDRVIGILILGISGLAIWGLWQSLGGLNHLHVLTETLPEHLRAGASARISRGRAFASLLLPSHLAVLLATVLPLLIFRMRRNFEGVIFTTAFFVSVVGLLATRSPVGVLLAIAACGSVLVGSKPKSLFWVFGFGLVSILLVVGVRPDVIRLEPLALRLDNWSSALWVWSTAPVAGVGLGGFGQASQAVPWQVGNHPVHAHSLPLELLADLGLFGLTSWVIGTFWILSVARKLWFRRPEVAAALLVVPAHNLVDFSLYTSGVALPWAVLLGWSLALIRRNSKADEITSPGFRWVPVFAGAVAVAVSLLAFSAQALVDAARTSAPLSQRIEWAQRAADLAIWNAEATDLVGSLALESGTPEMAENSLSFLETRRWQRPRSAARAQLMARLRALSGDPVGGLALLWSAREFQPYDGRRLLDFETAVEDLEGARRASR